MGQPFSPCLHSLGGHEEFSRRASRTEQAAMSKPQKGGSRDTDERFRMLYHSHHCLGRWVRLRSGKCQKGFQQTGTPRDGLRMLCDTIFTAVVVAAVNEPSDLAPRLIGSASSRLHLGLPFRLLFEALVTYSFVCTCISLLIQATGSIVSGAWLLKVGLTRLSIPAGSSYSTSNKPSSSLQANVLAMDASRKDVRLSPCAYGVAGAKTSQIWSSLCGGELWPFAGSRNPLIDQSEGAPRPRRLHQSCSHSELRNEILRLVKLDWRDRNISCAVPMK
ncbi:hypothetical protein KCU81_g116, partial [Aureobasidium melanogenum]